MTQEKSELFRWLLIKVQEALTVDNSPSEHLKVVCAMLRENVPHYNWVGFYLVSTQKARMLELGPYVGDATDHAEIPFGKGVCGQVAENLKPMIIQDVSQEANYLACSLKVKAEIVVPIFDESKEFVGQLDIDSHLLRPFTQEDWYFLEHVARLVRPQIIRYRKESNLRN